MEKEENVYEGMTRTEDAAAAEAGTKKDWNTDSPQEASTVPGKFKDVDALARAYSALEAEFTRRSQRLKELERTVDNLKSEAKKAEGSGAEKLRKNAEARRAATKEFDEFVAEVGRLRTTLAEEKPAEEEVLPEETAAQAAKEIAPTQDVGATVEAEDVSQASTAKTEYEDSRTDPKIRESEGEGLENAVLGGEKAQLPVANSGNAEALSEELYERVSRDEGVRLRIIGEYLSSIGRSSAPITMGNAGMLASPPVRAKSIGDAGQMALLYFQKPFGNDGM